VYKCSGTVAMIAQLSAVWRFWLQYITL